MIWADRFAIGIFVILLLISSWIALGENAIHGSDKLQFLLAPPAVGAGVCWIVLRTIDFMFGGPQRRRSNRNMS
jgi:hypothetical protein